MKRPLMISIIGILIAITLSATAYFQQKAAGKPNAEHVAESDGPRDHVELSPEKFEAAEITVAAAMRRTLRSQRIVPGHIEYNATRHVEVKSPFDGLIRQIDVKVGDRVTEGQVMAIVDSPELGEKRADVLVRGTDLQKAKVDFDWWHSIQDNLDELLARLKRPQEIVELEKDFAEKPLGDYRQQIFSAYSQMRLDETLRKNLDVGGSSKGTIAGKTLLERDAARDTSAAKYLAACEQARFDVKKHQLDAQSVMKDAEHRLAVAKQRLGLLVGQSQDMLPDSVNDASLSMWPVKAPFTGTVEEVLLAPKERIQTSQGLFQLADTSRLWVQADIRERDWPALSVKASQTVSVQTPALPRQTLEATVSFIGRAVAAETRAVPLIADIDNKDGQLRPGMFVRVLIPDGEPRECLTVPQSAIVTNDGRTFVFVETGTREYHPRDVKTGIAVDPWIEITTGLESEERIVTEGTAILKAELLLEAEE